MHYQSTSSRCSLSAELKGSEHESYREVIVLPTSGHDELGGEAVTCENQNQKNIQSSHAVGGRNISATKTKLTTPL